ncbi:MAG: hypothetical protein NC548_46000 [Lachnospiraceae bacterium]|nr:hypothetical protein [Lachnospiraceae bacterium]
MADSLIYRVVPDVTEQEILEHCKFQDLPDFGEHYEYKRFLEDVDHCCIMDYDGSGNLVIDGKEVRNSTTWLRDRAIWIDEFAKIPFQKLYEIFGDRVSFMWYNK